MPIEGCDEPSALQAGIISLYEDSDVVKLCDALYSEVADSSADLLQTVDSLVDCIKDLVDMASVCSKSTRPRRATATPKPAPKAETPAEVSEPAAKVCAPTPVARSPSPPPMARSPSPPPAARQPSPPPAAREPSPPVLRAASPPPERDLSPLREVDMVLPPPSPLELPPSAAMTEDSLLRAFVVSMEAAETSLQPVQEAEDEDADDYEDDDSPMIDLDEPAPEPEQSPPPAVVPVPARPGSSYQDPIRSKILMALRETQAENRRVLKT